MSSRELKRHLSQFFTPAAVVQFMYLEKRKPPEGHQTVLAEVEQLDLNGRPNPQLQEVAAAVHERQPRLARQSLLGL